MRLAPYLISFLFFLVSCTSRKDKLLSIVEDFAVLECRAIDLRKNRFALADSIRFSEDSILRFKEDTQLVHRVTARLQIYEQQKKILVKNSLELAETIRHQLDSLMNSEFSQPTHRRLFDQALEQELISRKCK